MAHHTKRTSVMLGTLAIVFVCIIIILCIVVKNEPYQEGAKSQEYDNVITASTSSTSPPSTSTTSSTTTTTSSTSPTTSTTSSTSSTTSTTSSTSPTTSTTSTTEETMIQAITEAVSTTQDSTTEEATTEPITEAVSTTQEAITELVSTTQDSTTEEATTESVSTTQEAITEPVSTTEDSTTEEATTEPVSTTQESTTEETTIMTTTTPVSTTPESTTPEPCIPARTCHSPSCTSLASDMLAMMDSSRQADPCKDFYQYACGGVMKKPNIHPSQPGTFAKIMIKDQLDKQDPTSMAAPGKMKKFYDSCLNQVGFDSKIEWAEPIKELFGKYAFSTNDAAENMTFDLSEALSYMMKKDFTPFFNMELEINWRQTNVFLMKLHPTVPGSRFSDDLARKVCLQEHQRRLILLENTSYNVKDEYETFRDCVGTGNGLKARLTRMEDAVTRMGLIHEPAIRLPSIRENTENFLIDLHEILPEVPVLLKELAFKSCEEITISELRSNVIDWATVLGEQFDIQKARAQTHNVHVYMRSEIEAMEEVLKKHQNKDPSNMNDILLMLWTERLYTDFVEPVGTSVGNEDYCLQTAINLMEDTASYLYFKAIAPQIDQRKAQIDDIVDKIKYAAWKELENIATDQNITQKLNDMMDNVMKLDTLDVEDMADKADESIEKVTLSDDFLSNSQRLLTNRRNFITAEAFSDGRSDDMWRVFVRPYDTVGVYNYIMNRIVIPYAAQEPFDISESIPKYLNYAGIGHMISHLVWHGYDTSGRGFQPKVKKLISHAREFKNAFDAIKKEYQVERNYTNPKGLQTIYDMSDLTLNEIWADTKATTLALEAYLHRNDTRPTEGTLQTQYERNENTRRRRRSTSYGDHLHPDDSEDTVLPYLGLFPTQLYYLHWAQHHCSDSSELPMLEVMESLQPPGRIRVNFVVENDNNFKDAFQCHQAWTSRRSQCVGAN